ncbi:MAG: hypothetical protein V1808_03075 [Candidatus Daviesbacteria bacterium]
MTSTQQFIPIEDIKNDLVFLKNGMVSLVLSTSAVNFALLFETEQISIIEDFAGLLNSLSFPIQIVILSKRLDVTSYLQVLDKASSTQTNPLLKTMTSRFRGFVESIIKENNVLDKQFYVCISASALEMGVFSKNPEEKIKRAQTLLIPRRDHLIRQLTRLGLKTKQLTSIELVKLFYAIYNPLLNGQTEPLPSIKLPPAPPRPPVYPVIIPKPPIQRPVLTRITPPNLTPTPPQAQMQSIGPATSYKLAPPYIVEELQDDFGP